MTWSSLVSGPHHGDDHLHVGGGQCPVQCWRHDPQDVILQDDWLLPPLQPQHHHPGHGVQYFHWCYNDMTSDYYLLVTKPVGNIIKTLWKQQEKLSTCSSSHLMSNNCSINEYFFLIVWWLFYSTKVYHTYMTAHIQEDFAPNEDDLEVERVNNK